MLMPYISPIITGIKKMLGLFKGDDKKTESTSTNTATAADTTAAQSVAPQQQAEQQWPEPIENQGGGEGQEQ